MMRVIHKSKDLGYEGEFEYDEKESQSQFWSLKLHESDNHYFADAKKFGFSVKGSYSVNGQRFTCGPGQCIGLYDLGRGSFTYYTAWYWCHLIFYLPDGRRFGLNLGDGIGVERATNDKAMEDFVVIDGKHFKLDQTNASFNEEDLLQVHTFKTTENKKYFPKRQCSITFTPVGNSYDGKNVIFINLH